jgi:hypothetical protein
VSARTAAERRGFATHKFPLKLRPFSHKPRILSAPCCVSAVSKQRYAEFWPM